MATATDTAKAETEDYIPESKGMSILGMHDHIRFRQMSAAGMIRVKMLPGCLPRFHEGDIRRILAASLLPALPADMTPCRPTGRRKPIADHPEPAELATA